MRILASKSVWLGGVVLGFVLGIGAAQLPLATQAEVRKSQNRANVPSGALQSVVVLQRMEKTLQSIDTRLSRVEKSVQQIADRPVGN